MKTTKKIYAFAWVFTCGLATTVTAQNLYVANQGSDTIGEYRLDGSTVNTSLGSGAGPIGIAMSGNLLWEYFFGPAQSHLDRLASFKLDRHTLAYLGKSINKLVAEVAWCERNPGVIPPPLVPHPRHRAHDVKRARDIEQMVTRLLENPALTDSEMGQEYAKKQKSEDYGTTGRKLAAEARNLAQWREGKAVERYIAKSGGRVFGRKPRRPVKSDNQK